MHGDGIRDQKKDVTKYSLNINTDSSLTFQGDGYPDMKLTKKSVATLAAPIGEYESSVLYIIDVTADFKRPLSPTSISM